MTAEDGGTYAHRCEVCNGWPHWTILRLGDVVTSWACGAHLHDVCTRLLRESIPASTEFKVMPYQDAGPIPWRPGGSLYPAPGRTGEWHELPDDGHDFDGCPCDPELHVSTGPDGSLRSVWRHKQRQGNAPH